MSHAVRAFWRIQLTRNNALTIATDDAPFTPYDLLIVTVRTPTRTAGAPSTTCAGGPALRQGPRRRPALQSMLTSYLPSAKIGTDVSIPELCHDMVFMPAVRRQPVCANKGC